jgi:hypothetical protein
MAASTGRCFTLVLAGSLPRKLSPFQFRAGRTGRAVNPPPQFGQTPDSVCSTHVAQNVHSYEQIRASSESGGNAQLQFSQVGLSSSMVALRTTGHRPKYDADLSRVGADFRSKNDGAPSPAAAHGPLAFTSQHQHLAVPANEGIRAARADVHDGAGYIQ